IEQVLELRAATLEARGVHVREVVRDDFGSGLLRGHSGRGGSECGIHWSNGLKVMLWIRCQVPGARCQVPGARCQGIGMLRFYQISQGSESSGSGRLAPGSYKGLAVCVATVSFVWSSSMIDFCTDAYARCTLTMSISAVIEFTLLSSM